MSSGAEWELNQGREIIIQPENVYENQNATSFNIFSYNYPNSNFDLKKYKCLFNTNHYFINFMLFIRCFILPITIYNGIFIYYKTVYSRICFVIFYYICHQNVKRSTQI